MRMKTDNWMSPFERLKVDADGLNAQVLHDFIENAEIVEGSDELYELVNKLWPELVHKLKPPRALMH
jgi:hypothetical protein